MIFSLFLFAAKCFVRKQMFLILLSALQKSLQPMRKTRKLFQRYYRLHELAEEPVKIIPLKRRNLKLFFLSDFQVKALTDYVHTTGQIVSVYELANIPGFDKNRRNDYPFHLSRNKMTISQDSVDGKTLISNFSFRTGANDASL